MIELMTRSYRDYLYGIYIIAPKPTTFKVVLHNKQYFYLAYLGPTYEATVAGKNYYLSDLGERERCTVAISKLLRGGSPINTKGPDGAEKGTKDESGGGGGGSTGGGGGEEGGGEELSASPEGGEGGGEAEELTESAKLILKLLLEQELDSAEKSSEEDPNKDIKDKESEKAEQSKKKSRLPQTPILSKNSLSPQKLGLGGITYKGPEQIVSAIEKSIQDKVLGENEYQVESTKNFILSLCKDIINNSGEEVNAEEISDFSDSIQFSKETIELSNGVNRTDLHSVIGVEFGEILGAMYLSKKTKKPINFPKEENNPIYDFELDQISVSSKYKKGAASSLSEVIEENDKSPNKNKLSNEAKKLLKTFLNSYKKSVSISYLYVAKNLNDPKIDIAFSALKKELDIDIKVSQSSDTIKKEINSKIEYLRKKEGDNEVKKRLNNFYLAINRKQIADNSQVRWHQLPKNKINVNGNVIEKTQYYGLITSPIAYYLTDVINAQSEKNSDKELLRDLIRNTTVKLLRLNFSLKDKATRFTCQSSKSEYAKFTFHPKVTANQPEKGFMSFRME
jgi:hypothetical protein